MVGAIASKYMIYTTVGMISEPAGLTRMVDAIVCKYII